MPLRFARIHDKTPLRPSGRRGVMSGRYQVQYPATSTIAFITSSGSGRITRSSCGA